MQRFSSQVRRSRVLSSGSILLRSAWSLGTPMAMFPLIFDPCSSRTRLAASISRSSASRVAPVLFGLGMLALGYSFGAGSAVVFAILGAASVLSFIKLGKRVFEFLDPEAVTSSLASDIATAVNSVAGTGLLARDRSIQAHHQAVAARKLDAWDEMVSVSIGRSQSASALKNIGQNTVSLLRWYSEAKLPIPRESYWFERTLEHPSYLLDGGSNLTSALGAGVWMSPKMEPDQLWLEKRAGEIIQRVVVALLEKGAMDPAWRCGVTEWLDRKVSTPASSWPDGNGFPDRSPHRVCCPGGTCGSARRDGSR